MRGASALSDVLRTFPEDAPLHVVVVWEPVLATDVGPPVTSVLARIGDTRVVQFWDPGLALSADIVRSVNDDPLRYGFEDPLPEDYVVWDVVAVFGGRDEWSADLPVPAYYDGPVYAVTADLRAAIDLELRRQVEERE